MKITHTIIDQTLYADIYGELDEHTATYARTYLDGAIGRGGFRQIVLGLAGLSFMDSTGIGVLLGRYKKSQSIGVPLYISQPSTQADKLLRLSGMYDIMPRVK